MKFWAQIFHHGDHKDFTEYNFLTNEIEWMAQRAKRIIALGFNPGKGDLIAISLGHGIEGKTKTLCRGGI